MAFAPHLVAICLLAAAPAFARVKILAAENVYGSVAQAVAGPAAEITSVLANPAQDPHDFEATAATARATAAADLVILNGLDYDPWMDRLLAASPRPGRAVIRVADLVGARPGDNPHLWYTPATVQSVAEAITAKLSEWDAANAPAFAANRKIFAAKVGLVNATIADLRRQFAHTPVTATEPVFGPMAKALGLQMRNEHFQWAVMNGTEPSAGDTAAIEDDLRLHRVRVLFHNDQVSGDAGQRLIGIATEAHVPIVGIDETMPRGTDYPGWMLHTLAAVRAALAKSQ